jgi:hypothetical protein
MAMRDDLAEWVWVLTCRRCSRVVDFDDACVPTRRLSEWATCCGEIMELESVLRSPADG